MSSCFICKRTGEKVCDGHCGLCLEADEPLGEDAHTSERMMDDCSRVLRGGTFMVI